MNQDFTETDPQVAPGPGAIALVYVLSMATDNQSLRKEKDQIQQYLREREWSTGMLYFDLAITEQDGGVHSFADNSRYGYSQFLAHARKEPREGDAVLLWDLSRPAPDQFGESDLADLRARGWYVQVVPRVDALDM